MLEVQQAADRPCFVHAAGAVKGLSIGYRTLDYEIDRTTGARKLKKVDLWEISPVTFAMLPEAQISGEGRSRPPRAGARAPLRSRFVERRGREGGGDLQEASP
jgi:phage head maturation protease